MVYILVMLSITSYRHNDNYVITMTSNGSFNRSHNELVKGLGTPSEHSDYVSRRRAFNRTSAMIYCNREKLTTFLTLTYAKQHNDYKKVVNDLKAVFTRRHISYVAVVEKHKSGMYHVHALCSDLDNITSLRKNKHSWKSWRRGFSDVKFISETDDKFRIEKYMFKYMAKAEKIGGRFFLHSRDLTVSREGYAYGVLPKPFLDGRDLDMSTYNIYNGQCYSITVERRYYGRNITKKRNSRAAEISQGELRGLRLL